MLNDLKRVVGKAALLGAVVLVPCSVQAKTLYVDGVNGNDATTYEANGSSSPWRTIGRAAWGSLSRDVRVSAQAARAGDTVLVSAGTYSVTGANERNIPGYYTENEGTAGNPIIFRAVGTVNLTLSSGSGPVIGSYDRDFIVWDGFSVHEANAPSRPDTGSVTVWLCNGCQLLNLDINGNGNANNRMDNHTGIRIEQSRNLLIRNNRIQNVYTGHNVANGAAIQVYSSGGVVFEHNEIFNCGSGIFLKGGPPTNNDYFTLRYNLIYNIGENRSGNGPSGSGIAVHAGAPNRPEAPVRIYGNVIRNSVHAAIRIWMFDGVDPNNNPMNIKIINNTISGAVYGLWVSSGDPLPNAGHVFWNNIVTNTSLAIAYGASNASNVKSRFDSEHNLFFSNAGFAETLSGAYTLPTWKSTFNQDNAATASIQSDPQFQNAGGNDFRLGASSPARSLGRDWLDLDGDGSTSDTIPVGAYVTGTEVVGRTGAPTTPPVPAPTAPLNLRIIR